MPSVSPISSCFFFFLRLPNVFSPSVETWVSQLHFSIYRVRTLAKKGKENAEILGEQRWKVDSRLERPSVVQ
jgi:hypothetical protein